MLEFCFLVMALFALLQCYCGAFKSFQMINLLAVDLLASLNLVLHCIQQLNLLQWKYAVYHYLIELNSSLASHWSCSQTTYIINFEHALFVHVLIHYYSGTPPNGHPWLTVTCFIMDTYGSPYWIFNHSLCSWRVGTPVLSIADISIGSV